jgi:hypothetical protein
MLRIVYRTSILLNALCVWVAAVVVVVVTAAMPASANDQSNALIDHDRWIPSIGFTLGFTTQQQEGSTFTEIQQGFFGWAPYDDRPPAQGDTGLNLLNVGGTFELQTPRLLPTKWSPRLFIGGEVVNVSSSRRSLAREGDPKTELIEPSGGGSFVDLAILGQGSTTESDAETAQFGAGIGLAFPVQIGEWRVSIKPSAQYLNQEFNFTGLISDADREDKLIGFPPTRVVLLTGGESLDVHAVGPGLEIEIEATQIRSIAASIFISGGAYNVLSNRNVRFQSITNATGNPNDTRRFRGTWTAEIDPWIYRASVGMRIKWLGINPGWLGGAFSRSE